MLFYRPACDISHCKDDDLVKIIKNKEDVCRRLTLLKCFNVLPDNSLIKHECCDVCDKVCVCDECSVALTEVINEPPEPLPTVRVTNKNEKEVVLECLKQLSLSKVDEKLVMENVNCIETEEDIMSLGIDEITSVFVKRIFEEVFGNAEVNDDNNAQLTEVVTENEIDLLSLDQPYEIGKNNFFDSDSDDEFWQDLF